jgi:hypothetical protein
MRDQGSPSIIPESQETIPLIARLKISEVVGVRPHARLASSKGIIFTVRSWDIGIPRAGKNDARVISGVVSKILKNKDLEMCWTRPRSCVHDIVEDSKPWILLGPKPNETRTFGELLTQPACSF